MSKIFHFVAVFLLMNAFALLDLFAQSGSISINCGGSTTGSFVADQYYSGGNTYSNSATINMSQITSNVPPTAIFNSERYGAMTYTIPVSTAGSTQTVTLYFAENYVTGTGQRTFNVSINGTTVLSNFDIFASAGGQNKAIARTFSTTANSSSQVVIQFSSVTQNPKINGITVTTGGSNTLSVSPNSLSLAAAANSTGSFSVTSNMSWTVASNQSWLAVSPTSGSNNGTVTVTAQQNTSTSSRTATVTVSATGVTSQTVSITQSGTGSTTINGNQVIVIGESFIAMSHLITQDLQQLAKNAGILGTNDKFIDNSVSGTRLSGGISPTIPQQYANGNTQKQVRWVIMDGGGNDCLGGSCSNPPTPSCADLQNATNAAKTLLSQMGKDGVVKVIYFFYPDPQQNLGGLQAKLDVLRPLIQNVVTSSTKPICYWLDLRPVFQGHYSEYVQSDGIHPTPAGCQATANAIWKVIQQNNFFSLSKSESAIGEDVVNNTNGIYLYPSPASEKVKVELPATPESEVKMYIYNVTGIQVKQALTKEKITTIDLTGFEKGLYYLIINQDNKTSVEKFVKQ